MPIRELFHSHFKFNSISTNPIQKVKDSLAFSEALLNQNPNFAQRNPNAIKKVQDLQQQNPNYLIHEYLNQDWQCFSFQQVVRILEETKLTYAGSTDLSAHLDNINFSEEHQQFLNKIEHPIFKEQCRDYFTNTQFRRDLFIRGKNNLSPLETRTRLRNTPFAILVAPEHFPKTITGYLGQFNLIPDVYEPLGKLFKEANYAPQTIATIEKKLPDQSYEKILNALVILCHLNLAQPCQTDVSEETLKHAHQLNRFILEQASFHNNYQVLACPISGIGLNADQFTQLFYRAHFIDGLKTAKQFAEYAQQALNNLGWFILDKGETITDKAQSLALLQNKAQIFLDQDLIKIAKQLKLFA